MQAAAPELERSPVVLSKEHVTAARIAVDAIAENTWVRHQVARIAHDHISKCEMDEQTLLFTCDAIAYAIMTQLASHWEREHDTL